MPMFIRLGSAVVALTLAAAPLSAQARLAGARLPLAEFTPYAGYLISGNIAEAPLGIELGSASGAMYGAQLSIPLTSAIARRGETLTTRADAAGTSGTATASHSRLVTKRPQCSCVPRPEETEDPLVEDEGDD